MRPLLILLLCLAPAIARARNLDIYWIDVEGGAATLIVAPSGQSLLIDTGNPGSEDRDARRIHEVATKLAGLTSIDYLLITHFHGDHVGGAPVLSKLMPINKFLDHGDSIQLQNARAIQQWELYKLISAGKRTIVKPGDKIPLRGVDIQVVASNGDVIAKPVKGGGPNDSLCKDTPHKEVDNSEDARSAGILLGYGKFRFLDLGDLTWEKELELACPVNKLGAVSIFQATMHGFYADRSGAPAHLYAVKPQVVVVNNGPGKGLQKSAYENIAKIPGVEGVWQSHLALANDKEHNTSEDMIANMENTDQCKGAWIKASVEKDGKYTITNGRNNFAKTYKAR